MFCEKCGNQLEEGVSICPKCNTPIDDKITVDDVKEVVKEKLASLNKDIQKAMNENKLLREKEEELEKIKLENHQLRVSNAHKEAEINGGTSEINAPVAESAQSTESAPVHVNVQQAGNPEDYIKLIISDYNPKYNYNPIGMWGYFGYTILFSIPIVGVILTFIFAFGAGKNINLRNFARSYFCVNIIIFVFILLMVASGAMLF